MHHKSSKQLNIVEVDAFKGRILIKTIQQCYDIIATHYDNKRDFDPKDFGSKISKMMKTLQNDLSTLTRFKGGYFNVHEPVINKNMTNQSPESMDRHLEKQEAILAKLPNIEKMFVTGMGNLADLKIDYLLYENKLKKTSISNIEDYISQWDKIYNNIIKHIKITKEKLAEVEK